MRSKEIWGTQPPSLNAVITYFPYQRMLSSVAIVRLPRPFFRMRHWGFRLSLEITWRSWKCTLTRAMVVQVPTLLLGDSSHTSTDGRSLLLRGNVRSANVSECLSCIRQSLFNLILLV